MNLRRLRGAFVLTLVMAVGMLPLSLCLDPAVPGDASMPCCVKGHDCPPEMDAHECCASPRTLDQQLVPGKSDAGPVIQPAVLSSWLAAAPIPAVRAARLAPAPRARSAPLYLVDSALRI